MKKYFFLTVIGGFIVAIIFYSAAPFIKSRVDTYINVRIHQALAEDALSLLRARNRIACEESAKYLCDYMSSVTSFPDKYALFKECFRNIDAKQQGLFCELGVGSGTTINFIADCVDAKIHGFDSFEGLPEDWIDGLPKGTFKMDKLPDVRPNVVLHKGWFDESLPKFKEAYKDPVSFLHMDADLYSSTKTVFEILGDRIIPGTVIQFDEFFNHPGWKDHEYKAFMEFVGSKKIKYEFIGFTEQGQVAVKILGIGQP